MRQICVLVLIMFIGMHCSSTNIDKNETRNKPVVITITGKIELYRDNKDLKTYIVKNWKTRSRISYLILNDQPYTKMGNKILTVSAELVEQTGAWSGKVNIIKVMEEKQTE